MNTKIGRILILAVIVGLFMAYAPLTAEAATRVNGGTSFSNAATLQRGTSYQLADHIKYQEFRYFKVPMVQDEQIPITVTNPNETIGHDGSNFITMDFHPEAQIHFITPDQGLIVTISAQGENKSITHYLTALSNGFGERANPTGFRGTKSSSNSDYLYIKLGNDYNNNTVSVHKDTLLAIGGSPATPEPTSSATPTSTPTASPTPAKTTAPTATASKTATPAATAVVTASPTSAASPTQTATASPTQSPEVSPEPSTDGENSLIWLWILIILLILLLLIWLLTRKKNNR